MKKLILFSLLAIFVFAGTANSQVTISGSTGANGSYTTLTGSSGAFNAINGTAQTGNNIVISITGNTTETGATSLNAGAWTTITINPSGGAARTIELHVSGPPTIDLNGADNITINGLNTGGNSLTISNSNLSSNASTIRFIADASNNTITNCTLLGSGTGTGTVFFSTGTTTGNIGNNINNCNIGPVGSNLPVYAIYSLGTSLAIPNTVTLNANNIFNYFSAASASFGINLTATGNTGWTITNNRLYQTATRIYTSSNTHNGIAVLSGSGYTITGNTIGFANSSGTGTTNIVGNSVALTGTFPSSYTTTGTPNATRYIALNCAFTAGGTVSSIQNNTIGGFALYTSSGATTTNGIWCGINITSGNANVGTSTGNTIGATSGTGSRRGNHRDTFKVQSGAKLPEPVQLFDNYHLSISS